MTAEEKLTELARCRLSQAKETYGEAEYLFAGVPILDPGTRTCSNMCSTTEE